MLGREGLSFLGNLSPIGIRLLNQVCGIGRLHIGRAFSLARFKLVFPISAVRFF